MSDISTNGVATLEAPAKAKRAARSPRPGVKRAIRKAAKVRSTGTGNGHKNDGCERVAKSSEGAVTTAQVRIMRFLNSTKGKPASRKDIKEAVGHWPNRKNYALSWIKQLRSLSPKMVKVEEHEPEKGNAKMIYVLTARGKELLEKFEKAAK